MNPTHQNRRLITYRHWWLITYRNRYLIEEGPYRMVQLR